MPESLYACSDPSHAHRHAEKISAPGGGNFASESIFGRLPVPAGEILIAIRVFAKTEVSSLIFFMLIFQHVILSGSSFFQVLAMPKSLN